MADGDDRQKKVSSSSRRSFLKIGAGVVAGAAVVSIAGIPLAGAEPSSGGEVQSLRAELDTSKTLLRSATAGISRLQAQTSDLQTQLDTLTGFLSLSVSEQALVESLAETIIPTDSNGVGAKEAGVIYFIDGQLEREYGRSANMYVQGPFVQPGQTVPVTVDGITYSEGSAPVRVISGYRYQYFFNMREFWRRGLAALEAYANSAYGGKYESLSSSQQAQVLQDLWNNTPAEFSSIVPQDFAYELFFMVWAGFLTDPLYGGNRNMVGWEYVAFNGTNQGNFYGEGLTTKELMVATTPTRLRPASLAQFEKGSP